MYKCNADTTEFVKINGLVAQGKIQFVTFISSLSFMKNLIKKLSNSFLIIGVCLYIYVCVRDLMCYDLHHCRKLFFSINVSAGKAKKDCSTFITAHKYMQIE